MNWEVASFLRSCCFCQALSVSKISRLFCTNCEKKILVRGVRKSVQNNLKVYSVFDWWPDAKGVERLIHSLKGPGPVADFQFLSSVMAWNILASDQFEKELRVVGSSDLIWVPAPPRVHGAQDHAYRFARALQEGFGGQLGHEWLYRIDLKEQKSKSKEERGRLKLGAHVKAQGQPIVFVDDLLASGATAQAAYQALDRPERFIVFTVAYRPRLQNGWNIDINSDA